MNVQQTLIIKLSFFIEAPFVITHSQQLIYNKKLKTLILLSPLNFNDKDQVSHYI